MQTLSVIITQVRSDLQDPDPPAIDWSAADLLNYWNLYVQLLFRERPDSRLAMDGSITDYAPATDPTLPVIVDDTWIEAGIYEVKSQAYAKDGAAKRNLDLSNHFHEKCLATLRGT